jgi:signal transduction histidine kinase/DNA-binding response OmpR family regulator/streptogramin lyase
MAIMFLANKSYSGTSGPYKFGQITNKDGLSQSEVLCILQDNKGFMWFGTLDGLNKYDGYTIKSYYANFQNDKSLSHSSINCMTEDSYGRIWIGTLGGGVNVFIPWKDKFYNIASATNTLSDNKVISLKIDNNRLWIGTARGINWMPLPDFPISSSSIDSIRSSVHALTKSFTDPIISSRRINSIEKIQNNILWLGTFSGVIPINTRNNSILPKDSSKIYRIKNGVESIYKDHLGQVWVGTRKNGLFRVTFSRDGIEKIDSIGLDQKSQENSIIMTIIQDDQKNLWIGTRGSGIKVLSRDQLDKDSYTFTTISKQSNNSINQGINSNFIKTLYTSRNGIVWAGTLGNGVNYYDPCQKQFYHYKIPASTNTNNFIRAVFHDEYNNLWLGTLGNGLHILHEETRKHINSLLENKSIFAAYKISRGNLLIGGTGGLYLFKYSDNDVYNHRKISNIESTIHGITKSSNHTYWLGAQDGIYRITFSSDFTPIGIEHYQKNLNSSISLTSNNVRVVKYDSSRNSIWAGTEGGGLNCLVLDQNHRLLNIFHFSHNQKKNSISSDFIRDIHIDSQNQLWLGTYQGLNKMTIRNNQQYHFEVFNNEDGNLNNLIQSIVEDKHHNLWMGTNQGLVCFSKKDKKLRIYNIADGIQSSEFSEHTKYINKNGKIFFGGINGVTAFYPDSIHKNLLPPHVTVNEFRIKNKPLQIQEKRNGRIILKKAIIYTDTILLRYNERNFSFRFSGLHYSNPQDIQYAYMLEGCDERWIYVPAQNRIAKYTNINPGTYTFKVKASNKDGVWSTEPDTILLEIQPPIWATTWAYVIYIILLIGIGYIFLRYMATKANRRKEKALNEKHQRKMAEVNKMKLRFFTNVSHEFRTPLTLIFGPLENLSKGIKKNSEQFNQLRTIKKNADRLYRLIDQLLEMRKIETGNSELIAEQNDIITFTGEIVNEFKPLAQKRNISLSFHSEKDTLNIWFDVDKMEKVLFNVISNAMKYTEPGGEISIRIKQQKRTFKLYKGKLLKNILLKYPEKQSVVIQISDTGKGIPREKLNNIFQRFYYSGEEGFEMKGQSIGLSLTKDLVELHQGDIHINSKPDKGTIISIYLPKGKLHLSEDEIKKGKFTPKLTQFREAIHHLSEEFEPTEKDNSDQDINNTPSEEGFRNDCCTLLIIDDNKDMRDLLKSNLKDKYNIYTASDGEEGLKTAASVIPDLIISDVMMPKVNGFEVCKQIKSDINTSHIPIILLTVRKEQEAKYEGIQTGADDYIAKPFDMHYLTLKIESLIQSRNELKKRFENNDFLSPKEVAVTSVDEKFVEKIQKLMEEHMDNPEFNVDQLIQEVGMSRTNFYRKIKSLIGVSGKGFIDTMRLKRAAYLLKQNKLNVSEVAYSVGHNNPRYFTKWFKDHYQMCPSEYAKKYKTEGSTDKNMF